MPEITHPITELPEVFERADRKPCHLAGLYQGRSAFLIASGPSFAQVNLELLRSPGCLTLGVNNAPRSFRPNLWTSADPPSNFLQSIWLDPTILKFVRSENADQLLFDNQNWTDSALTPRDCPATVLYRSNTSFRADRFLSEDSVNWGNDNEHGGGRSVLLAALKLLYCLGIGNVFLLGVDFTMTSARPYHFDETRDSSAAHGNNRSYRILARRFEQLQPEFLRRNFHVWNCNPDSQLKAFPFLPFEEAIEFSLSELPSDLNQERTQGLYRRARGGNDSIDGELPFSFTHSQSAGLRRIDRSKQPVILAANEIKESKSQPVTEGIVLLADLDSEWLLPWWHGHFAKSGMKAQVTVIDAGISDSAKSFVASLDKVNLLAMSADVPQFECAWFLKPFALAASPYERSIFLDLDCEVRSDISEMFNWSEHGIVLGHDKHPMGKYRRLFRGAMFFNSGVIGVTQGAPIINQWCQSVGELHHLLRGDQEVLNLSLYENEATIVELPPHFHQLRLDGDHPQAKIMHWTGPAGKEHIRRKILESA